MMQIFDSAALLRYQKFGSFTVILAQTKRGATHPFLLINFFALWHKLQIVEKLSSD